MIKDPATFMLMTSKLKQPSVVVLPSLSLGLPGRRSLDPGVIDN